MTVKAQGATPVEIIAAAVEEADATFGYAMNLTRLVDGEATYTLSIEGEAPVDLPGTEECYERIARVKAERRAQFILEALRQAELLGTAADGQPSPLQAPLPSDDREGLVKEALRLAGRLEVHMDDVDRAWPRASASRDPTASVMEEAADHLRRLADALSPAGRDQAAGGGEGSADA